MANSDDWMKAGGQALMGGLQTFQVNRKMEMEEQKDKRLAEIAEGRLGVDKEYVALQGRRMDQQDSDSRAESVNKTIATVQERLDQLIDPDDMAMQELLMQRAEAVKSHADSGMAPEDLTKTLNMLESNYREQRMASLEPGTDAYKARQSGMDSYIDKIYATVKTGNARMRNQFGDEWSGDVAEVLFMNKNARDAIDAPIGDSYEDATGGPVGDRRAPQMTGEPGAAGPPVRGEIGRDFGLMSRPGGEWATDAMFGSGEGDIPYLEGNDPYGVHTAAKGLKGLYRGYQENIGQPFSRFMLGDRRPDRNQTPTVGTDVPLMGDAPTAPSAPRPR